MTFAGRSELDRVAEEAALDAALDKLTAVERQLAESEADRRARLELIHARDRAIVDLGGTIQESRALLEETRSAIGELKMSLGETRVRVDALGQEDVRLAAAFEARAERDQAALRDALAGLARRVDEQTAQAAAQCDALSSRLEALTTSLEETRVRVDALAQEDARLLAAIESRSERDQSALRDALAGLARRGDEQSAQAAAQCDAMTSRLQARVEMIEARLAQGLFARLRNAVLRR